MNFCCHVDENSAEAMTLQCITNNEEVMGLTRTGFLAFAYLIALVYFVLNYYMETLDLVLERAYNSLDWDSIREFATVSDFNLVVKFFWPSPLGLATLAFGGLGKANPAEHRWTLENARKLD